MKKKGPENAFRQSMADHRGKSKGMERGGHSYAEEHGMDEEDQMRLSHHMMAAHHKFMAQHHRRKMHKKR